jgi:hypothetical protein
VQNNSRNSDLDCFYLVVTILNLKDKKLNAYITVEYLDVK